MVFNFCLAVTVLTLAGFIQGLTGFGFGLVAMALLPSLIDFHLAALLVVLFTFPVSAIGFYENRKHYQWRNGWTLIVGMFCGVPIGVYMMVHAPRELLLRLLGLLLVAFALNETVFGKRKLQVPQWMGFPLGLCSGVLGGAFNVGGPTSVAYCYARPWSKEEVVAVLQLTFIGSALMRLALFGANGLLTNDATNVVAWAAVPVLISLLLGMRLFKRIEQEQLRLGIYCFIGVMGVKYLISP